MKTYFTPAEFLCRGPHAPTGCTALRVMDPELLDRLTVVRFLFGMPMRVNSGLRCAVANAAVGGVAGSEHMVGMGVDIACPDSSTRFALLKYGLQADFTRMGIGKNFIHFGVSHALAPLVCWTYYP